MSRQIPAWAMRLSRERRQRGWSQTEMARRLTQAGQELGLALAQRESVIRRIRDWEAGRNRPKDPYPVLYARAFGVDEDVLFADAAASPALPLPSLPEGAPVTEEYVAALRDSCRALVTLDNTAGGTTLVPVATGLFTRAHAHLASGRYLPRIEHDLEAAVGEIGEIAAWFAYEADRQELSRRLITEALTVSRLAGDHDMEVLGLSHLAMQGIYLGRSREALKIAESVLAGRRLSGRMAALFHIRRGRALAQLGDMTAAHDALGHAEALVNDGIDDRDPAWTWWIDAHELTWHRAMCHVDASQWGLAAEAAAVTAETCRPGNARCGFNDYAHLLAALTHARAWREAEPVAAEVIKRAAEVRSARTENLLRRVADQIIHAAPGPPSTLVDSAEYLRQTLSGKSIPPATSNWAIGRSRR